MGMTVEEAIKHFENKLKSVAMPASREAFALALSALRAQHDAEKNEPLTLEELREMKDMPIWLVNNYEPRNRRWVIVDGVDDATNTLFVYYYYICENYGEEWLAYRRPPETAS